MTENILKFIDLKRKNNKKKENVTVPEFVRRQKNVRVQFILLGRGKQIQIKLKWEDMPVRAQG